VENDKIIEGLRPLIGATHSSHHLWWWLLTPDQITKFCKESWNVFSTRNNQNNKQQQQYINYLISLKKGNRTELTENDFFENFDIKWLGETDLFSGKLAIIFKDYQRREENNLIKRIKKEHLGKEVKGEVLTDEQFIEKFGTPPWNMVNNVLEQVHLPYTVNNPNGDDVEASFSLKFIDKTHQGVNIQSTNLSTGEKVLLALGLAIYNTGLDCQKPDLLLIDEPDAGLHPSMSKDMISIIEKYIVAENKIPVIITTHSPTTIIATEGITIYEKQRDINEPQKLSRQEAINILTEDIPFLRLSMEKRRPVFVESEYDADFYERLTNVYNKYIKCQPLYFQVKKEKTAGSNCIDVIQTVNNLQNCENDLVYGIVDWDLDKTGTKNVFALGNGERYAIENYLLDPLLVGLLLIILTKKNFSDFGITRLNNFLQIQMLNEVEAQQIIDWILHVLDLEYGSNPIKYVLLNKWELHISTEFNQLRGHDLEDLYKKKIPELNIYNNEGSVDKNLKKQIIIKVIEGCPNYICKNVIKTIENII
jgi:hypothetical protein